MLLPLLLPPTNCQLFRGLFADIDVGTARQMGFNFDGPAGINFNKAVDDWGAALASNAVAAGRSHQTI